MMTERSKEELLIQAVRTQHSILNLLDNTLLEIYAAEKEMPEEKQNQEVVDLAYQIRNIVARKPDLKEIYRKLEEEHDVDLGHGV